MVISLLVILAAVMWTFTAGSALNFCKRLWKSSSQWKNQWRPFSCHSGDLVLNELLFEYAFPFKR
jgi:hypothetical protein